MDPLPHRNCDGKERLWLGRGWGWWFLITQTTIVIPKLRPTIVIPMRKDLTSTAKQGGQALEQ